MAIIQSLCTSFKVELLDGVQDFSASGGDTFKMALYTSSASLGGNTLVISQTPTSGGTTAFLSFTNTTWTGATFTCRGAMIYNSSKANRSVAIFDFGSDKTVLDGTFTIEFPVADATSAVIRIA